MKLFRLKLPPWWYSFFKKDTHRLLCSYLENLNALANFYLRVWISQFCKKNPIFKKKKKNPHLLNFETNLFLKRKGSSSEYLCSFFILNIYLYLQVYNKVVQVTHFPRSSSVLWEENLIFYLRILRLGTLHYSWQTRFLLHPHARDVQWIV